MIIVETERLSIREITQDDALALANVLADPVVMKYSTVGVHSTDQIINYIANCQHQYELNGYGHWAIYNTDSGEFVGVCGLNKHDLDSNDVIHINYRLATSQQGRGYAVEATLGILDFAKNSLKLNVIHALIEPENTSSVNVVNRTGFEFVKSSFFRGFHIDVYHVIL